jgi:hypothetical protein
MTREMPVAVFRIFDRDGQPIGEIVQPQFEPLVGRGAETVLLVRGGSQSLVPAQHTLLRV